MPRCCARAGRAPRPTSCDALAAGMRADFNRHLIRDGVVAGYALFDPDGAETELLLHPSDTRTGLAYSLLPMTQGIIGGLFDRGRGAPPSRPDPRAPALSRRRAADGPAGRLPRRDRAHLPPRRIGGLFRPRDRPHVRPRPPALRRGAGGARRGATRSGRRCGREPDRASPRPSRNASLRQRNAYFSSSDAAFPDRYRASAEWDRVRDGTVAIRD